MTEYVVVYETDGDGWSAYLPDVPGCVAAGRTREETEQAIRVAVSMHVEGLRDAGLAVPPATTVAGIVAA